MKKRIRCFVIALVMVFGICSNCFTVFAFDDTNEGGSETATEKFNEFLSALTPEAASAIRQDDEMVYMMTQDFYWSPPTVSSARRASLPLSEYGNGTYYTNNGLACICHAKCTYSTPGAKDTLCYIIDQKNMETANATPPQVQSNVRALPIMYSSNIPVQIFQALLRETIGQPPFQTPPPVYAILKHI